MTIPDDLEASFHHFDSLQSICSMDYFMIAKPDRKEMLCFLEAIDQMAALVERKLCAG
jgi:hypothetical protein